MNDFELMTYSIRHEKKFNHDASLTFNTIYTSNYTRAICYKGCGFHKWNKKHDRAELFYALRTNEVKLKGYMSEVVPVVLKHGFNEMNLHRIEALIANWNEPSIRLLKKNDFTFEGTNRED